MIASDFLTKMKGKMPTRKVIRQLMDKAARALSFPVGLEMDTNTEKNINNALTKSAKPTFLDITLTFISQLVFRDFFLLVLPDVLKSLSEHLVVISYF